MAWLFAAVCHVRGMGLYEEPSHIWLFTTKIEMIVEQKMYNDGSFSERKSLFLSRFLSTFLSMSIKKQKIIFIALILRDVYADELT